MGSAGHTPAPPSRLPAPPPPQHPQPPQLHQPPALLAQPAVMEAWAVVKRSSSHLQLEISISIAGTSLS